MNRNRLVPVLLAGLCALALLLTAATITSTVRDAPSGDGAGGDRGGGVGVSSGDGVFGGGFGGEGEGSGLALPAICLSLFAETRTLLLIVGVILLVGLYHASRGDPVGGTLLSTVLLIPVAAFYLFLRQSCRDQSGVSTGGGLSPLSGGGGGGILGSSSVDPQVSGAAAVVAAVLFVAALGVLVMIVVQRSDDEVDEDDDPDLEEVPAPEADVQAVGTAAGAAADRIDRSADPANEIYRAWVAMTEPLDVDHPDSSTPAEFARAAVDAGVDRDDVSELTEVFEAVRYGERDVTEERITRATRALRRIERTYGDGEQR